MKKLFDLQNWLILFISLVIMRVVGGGLGGDFAFLILAILAILGGKFTIFALMSSWFLTLINPTLVVESSFSSLARYIIVLCAFLSIFCHMIISRKFIVSFYILPLSVVFICIFVHSLLISYAPLFSILKLISWYCVIVTLLITWYNLSESCRYQMYATLTTILKFIICASLPLLLFPQIGFARNGTGFQGLLNHPQAFGPTSALLAALLIGGIISNKKIDIKNIIWFLLCIICIVLSEARTAGLALAISVIIAIIFNPILQMRSFFEANPIFKNRYIYVYIAVVITGAFILFPWYGGILQNYLFKRTDSTSLFEAAEASRGKLVDMMLSNIENNPWFGLGFGVASDPMKLEIVRDPIFNLPISAPIEKGVLPVAIIEELGFLLGGSLLLWFIFSFIRAANISAQNLSLALCIFFLNFGEYMFFSTGGMGMLMLIFFTYSVTKD